MIARHDMITIFVVRPDETGESQEFLQLLRSESDDMGGTWQIVRGGVDAGETAIQGALREMREETGLVPRELYRLGSLESFYTVAGDTVWHSVAFCAMVDRNQSIRLNEEHTDYRWIEREKMDSVITWASERQLLSDLCRDILDHGPARPLLRVQLA